MPLNYERRLSNLQSRRYDNELNESVISKSFSNDKIPKNIKYLYESMSKIDSKYNERTYDAANRVQKHLEGNFNLHFDRAYRTQGSVVTGTNIKVHSDFDLLVIINKYHFNGPNVPINNPYTDTDHTDDIKDLRKQSENIMSNIYDEVDKTGRKNISIFNKSLNRKVDIVFCFWYHTQDYIETQNEYYRGIYLYDFIENEKISDFPFAHISQVNAKGETTNDGSRKAIRLLKTLKADSLEEIKLSSFDLTTIVHSIEDNLLYYHSGKEVQIAKVISNQLLNLINNSELRKSIKSPNGTENPLTDDCVSEMRNLKKDLDELIEDVSKELYNSYFEKGELIYS
ncbi:hypothetical protein SAMN05421664_3793 [Chryseobacterium soldanellicola]|uniref:Nucleotidyltransferase domain-containing protein n=1 Tax=Chryseobacterium soldanellicola TaxID=311333 RepID=A0A1H1GNK9_9FLAO|nr:hypothetical protein [Chryseobacterium soldanellicola]SDR14804.1 hypothetical protein SAMN05421664_3793 [Chryseobacterium soldanellicola]